MTCCVSAGITHFLHSVLLLVNFALNIVGIVPNIRAETDEPTKKTVNNALDLRLPVLPELVEVVLALVGAVQDLALVQQVVHHHRVHADLELAEELPVVPPQLGDEPGPGDENNEKLMKFDQKI